MEWWEKPLKKSELDQYLSLRELQPPTASKPIWVSKVLRPVIVTCWIPGLSKKEIPAVFWDCIPLRFEIQNKAKQLHPALFLFASGNHYFSHPDYLSGEDLLNLAQHHNCYRALLCLKDIQVFWDKDRRPLFIEAQLLQAVGLTPIRTSWKGPTLWKCMGEVSSRILFKTDELSDEKKPVCKLRIEMAFRLAGVALVLANTATPVEAPYVWISLTTQIQLQSMQVKLEGTVIPSQTLYINNANQKQAEYDMLSTSCRDLEILMQTGKHSLAPGRPEESYCYTKELAFEQCADVEE